MLEAISKNGKKVYLSFVPDCEDNEGGWFVEVYFDEHGDYHDYFCIHPEDCDCKNQHEVDECAKRYISEIEYYFTTKKKYVIRFNWRQWVDITVEATNESEAYELAGDRYNEGDYEEDSDNFENLNAEVVTLEYEENGDPYPNEK